jgi:hypothetical protein
MCLRVAAGFCQFRDDGMCVVYFDLKNDFRAGGLLEVWEGNGEVGVTVWPREGFQELVKVKVKWVGAVCTFDILVSVAGTEEYSNHKTVHFG